MGFNTTVVVMNDSLDAIERDPNFGKKLVNACLEVTRGKPVDVSAMGHGNAATVIETHHADGLIPVLVGSNYGYPLNTVIHWKTDEKEMELMLIKQLAEKHGYTLRRKPAKKLKR